jgi:cell division septation protein DedD
VPVPPTGEALNRTVQSEVGQGITVQVVAVSTKQDAERVVNILRAQGYPVFLVTPEYARAEDNLFRVQVGPFKDRDDADKVRAKLAQEGFKPFIRH